MFGKWSGVANASISLPPPQRSSARLIIVDKPGAPQTELRIGTLGIAPNSADCFPAVVMNEVLGGMVSSRLSLNLREDKGYTYGAFSQFRFNRWRGPFIITSAVRTDATAPAIAEVFTELRAIADRRIPDAELSKARESVVRSLPLRFETSSTAALLYGLSFICGRPPDYWSNYPSKIAGVDAEATLATAKKLLRPEHMIVVAIGDRGKIESAIRQLSLGAMEIRDTDGKVVASEVSPTHSPWHSPHQAGTAR